MGWLSRVRRRRRYQHVPSEFEEVSLAPLPADAGVPVGDPHVHRGGHTHTAPSDWDHARSYELQEIAKVFGVPHSHFGDRRQMAVGWNDGAAAAWQTRLSDAVRDAVSLGLTDALCKGFADIEKGLFDTSLNRAIELLLAEHGPWTHVGAPSWQLALPAAMDPTDEVLQHRLKVALAEERGMAREARILTDSAWLEWTLGG